MESRQIVNKDERVAFWPAQVEAWRTSGVSQSRYSREQGIRKTDLSYWIRRVKTPATPLPLPNLVKISTETVVQAVRSASDPAPRTLMIADCYQFGICYDFYALVLEKLIRTLERL